MSILNPSLMQKVAQLPPLPDSVIKIRGICNDSNAGIKDLSDVVERDPILSAHIMKAANSPLYGFSREIKNISHAISLFGMATVLGFALATTVRQKIKVDLGPYGISPEEFITASQKRSSLMMNWYGRVNRGQAAILTPASFIEGIGMVVVAMEVLTEGKGEGFHKELLSSGDQFATERRFVGAAYPEVSAEVFQFWSFEPTLVEVIRESAVAGSMDKEIRVMGAAMRAVQAAISPSGKVSKTHLAQAREMVERAGMDGRAFEETVKKLSS